MDEIDVGGDPTSIVADGDDFLWVTNRGDGTLSEIDLADRRVVATVDVGELPQEAAVDADSVWVASEGTQSLLRVDKATGEVTDTLELGLRVEEVAIDDQGHPWVDGLAQVIKVDPETMEIIGELVVGGSLAGVTSGEGSIWVNPHDGTRLSRIDPS